jgi:tryptophan synthase beta chain
MMTPQPDAGGHFGPYGGRFVPEVLMAPLEELEKAYLEAREDPAFQAELSDLLHNYAGRPTPLYFARRLSEQLGGARIWLKREDLLHTGAHKINNALGQGCWRGAWASGASSRKPARASTAWPRPRFARCWVSIAWSTWARRTCAGSGSTSSACACWARKWSRDHGSRTLKDAISEAMRDWVTNVADTYYLLGSALGAHPYPMMVRDFQKVIGEEARARFWKRRPPARRDLRCVGGGSNAIGIFPRVSAGRKPCGWSAWKPADAASAWASMRRASAAARPACCKARTATCCRTTTARSR